MSGLWTLPKLRRLRTSPGDLGRPPLFAPEMRPLPGIIFPYQYELGGGAGASEVDSPAIRAGSRRRAGTRSDRGHPVPQRRVLDAGGLPRGRPVLRAVGIPDHDAVAAGTGGDGSDRFAGLLDPAV